MFITIREVVGGWIAEINDFKPDCNTISGTRLLHETMVFATGAELVAWFQEYVYGREGKRLLEESSQ